MAKHKCAKHSPFKKDDWTEESLAQGWEIIAKLAKEKYGLDFYKPAFEVVTFEDMLHIYTGSLPITYDHWSFGKAYEQMYQQYMHNRMGIAYEVVFNTSPALCYLLEHNSPTMQALVQAHASVGHSAFFKNNVLFKEMTNAATIIPILKNAKAFIAECEETYGQKEVERLLDVCHALSYYAIDRRPVVNKTQKQREAIRLQRLLDKDRDYDLAVHSIPLKDENETISSKKERMREENIVKFMSKHSPTLKPWQREILNIYCKIQQYLYPQMLTKLMNEGFASFWHHTIMTDLGEMGLIDAGGSIEFLHSHCSVLRQPDFDQPGGGSINPYKLGYEMFKDIRRICENPTQEDREWFPHLVGKNWIEEVKYAAYNFKDESFILQYLSPKLMRDLKMFILNDNQENDEMEISDIHDDEGYKQIRAKLSKSYNFMNRIPDIYIEGFDAKKSRTLYMCFQEHNKVELDVGESSSSTMQLVKTLWPFPINFKILGENGAILQEMVG